MKKLVSVFIGLCLLLGVYTSCKSQTCVVTATATGIGLRASYDQKTQMPLGELGYIHSAVAIVPTDRQADGEAVKESATAANSTDVINEISFNNFFSFWNENGIYERIAVGKNAVSQPGAVALFAKNNSGNMDANSVKALEAIYQIKSQPVQKLDLKLKLAQLVGKDIAKQQIAVDTVSSLVPNKKIQTWVALMDNPDISDEVLTALISKLETK